MRKFLIFLALLLPLIGQGQDTIITPQRLNAATSKWLKQNLEFERRTNNGEFGIFPGESPSDIIGRARVLAADNWGAVQMGGTQYRAQVKAGARRMVWGRVFDTGKPNHNDLNPIIAEAKNFLKTGETVDDGHGHSTHVSGLIAGNPQTGIITPAAGLRDAGKIKILISKVLSNSGFGSMTDIIDAVKDALASDVPRVKAGDLVIWNFSLGGGTQSVDQLAQLFNQAWAAGIIVCAANGNGYSRGVNFPANHPTNFAVAAGVLKDNTLVKDAYSDYGVETFVLAPGTNVNSTLPGNQYGAWSGTSMATPMFVAYLAVAGSILYDKTPAQLMEWVKKNLQDTGTPGRDELSGFGIPFLSQVFSSSPPDPTPTLCNPPTTAQLSALNVSSSGATLTCSATAKSFSFRYREFNKGDWTTTAWQTNNVTVSGLKPFTVYEVQAAIQCNDGKISSFSPSIGFKTLNESTLPVKPQFEWKSYSMPPSDQLTITWKAEGQTMQQKTSLSNIKILCWTNGFEWAQDLVMGDLYSYLGQNLFLTVGTNNDNETVLKWVALLIKSRLEGKFKDKYNMQFKVERIAGETGGGSLGVRYCDLVNPGVPIGSIPTVQEGISNDSSKAKNWWYE